MLDRLLAFALVVGLLLAVGAAMKDEAVEGEACPLPCDAPASPPLSQEREPSTPRAPLASSAPRGDDREDDEDDDDEREEKREKKTKGKKGKGAKRDD